MTFIQNLRIGIKLAVASGLGMLLVAAMIYIEITGGTAVRTANEAAFRSLAVSEASAETQGAVRNMQIGIRDILLSHNVPDLDKATKVFAERSAATGKLNAKIAGLTTSPDARAQTEQLTPLIGRMEKGAEHIEAVTREVIGLEAKRASDPSAEPRLEKLAQEIVRIRREETIPAYDAMEKLTADMTLSAQKRAETSEHLASEQSDSVEYQSLLIGLVTAVLLIGTCVFSVFTIARPMRALSRSMEELAEGNFAVVLPGLGRKD